jgi:Domain of unknown function (DUF4184)
LPFTLSHPLAVLPLLTGRPARKLVPAALVIGSMIPDLPYFVPPHPPFAGVSAEWTHAASGPFTIDLALGLLAYAIWSLGLRLPLVDLAPQWWADRISDPRRPTARDAGWIGLSIIIGAVTHVVWDTFTHARRWGTTHLPALQVIVGGLPIYKWLQFGSGAVGLLVLAVWVVRRLRRTDPHRQSRRLGRLTRTAVWVGLSASVMAGALILGIGAVLAGRSAESIVVGAVTGSISFGLCAVVLVSLGWQLRFGRAG